MKASLLQGKTNGMSVAQCDSLERLTTNGCKGRDGRRIPVEQVEAKKVEALGATRKYN